MRDGIAKIISLAGVREAMKSGREGGVEVVSIDDKNRIAMLVDAARPRQTAADRKQRQPPGCHCKDCATFDGLKPGVAPAADGGAILVSVLSL
jgi:hypothetical protein